MKENIPFGDYCYTWIETPSAENDFRGKVQYCPFYQYKNINGIQLPWCSFLKKGDIGNLSKEEGQKVEKYFKNHKRAKEKFSLFLLWDGCKECNVNIN